MTPTRNRSTRPSASNTSSALPVSFTARIEHSGNKGGWSYVVWPKSAQFFATRGLVKVSGTMDGVPFRSSFMALGDGRHKLPVKAGLRQELGKDVGDAVRVEIRERLR